MSWLRPCLIVLCCLGIVGCRSKPKPVAIANAAQDKPTVTTPDTGAQPAHPQPKADSSPASQPDVDRASSAVATPTVNATPYGATTNVRSAPVRARRNLGRNELKVGVMDPTAASAATARTPPRINLPSVESKPSVAQTPPTSFPTPAESTGNSKPLPNPIALWAKPGASVQDNGKPAAARDRMPLTPPPPSIAPRVTRASTNSSLRLVVGKTSPRHSEAQTAARPVPINPYFVGRTTDEQWREFQRLKAEKEHRALEEQRERLRRTLYRLLLGEKEPEQADKTASYE